MVGTLCFSFDFELAWGTRSNSNYGLQSRACEATWETVDSMLGVLQEYDIPATWATVGAIMLQRPKQIENLKQYEPRYPWFKGNWYDFPGYDSDISRCYYAPQLVECILKCKTPQEIACHTFSHIYMNEPASTPELLDMELKLCQDIARQWGLRLSSLVFPKNMVNDLPVLVRNGFDVFRSRNTEWYWFKHRVPSSLRSARGPMKIFPCVCNAGRYFDEKIRLTPAVFEPTWYGNVLEIKHSSFLPGFSKVSKYVSINDRVRRMEKGMLNTIRKGGVFSIFFHPHNLNYRRTDCLKYFSEICRIAAQLRETHGLRIRTMQDIAQQFTAKKAA